MRLYVVEGQERNILDIEDNQKVARGGAGIIFRINSGKYAGSVAKIFHDTASFEPDKIATMIEKAPLSSWMNIHGQRVPQFTWPTHILENESNKGVGFLMPYVDTGMAVSLNEYIEEINSLPIPDRSITVRVAVARNLAAGLAELHKKKSYFVDLKPQNILVFKETGNVCLLDCDGYSIDGGKFPAKQFSSQYLAPEVLINRADPRSLSLNDYQDRFALGVLIFQILNYGVHPFQGVPNDKSIENATTDEFVKRGWYPYGATPNQNLAPTIYSIHEYWDNNTRELFERTFTAARPSERPTALEWASHFDRLIQNKAFKACDKFPNDILHLHFKEKSCFVCKVISNPDIVPVPSSQTPFGMTTQLPKPAKSWFSKLLPFIWFFVAIKAIYLIAKILG